MRLVKSLFCPKIKIQRLKDVCDCTWMPLACTREKYIEVIPLLWDFFPPHFKII
uniref:Uncharacterized protein n=1 Tax=Anguilla anguilla TaxID=7936 RepID=A0A0E9WBU5_ANGAN